MNRYRILKPLLCIRTKQQQGKIAAHTILIICLQGLGDLIMTTPLIHELAQAGKQVDVLTLKKNMAILARNKDVHRIIEFTPSKLLSMIRYDLAYLSFGSGPKSGFIFNIIRAKHKASHIYQLTDYTTHFNSDIIIRPTPQLHRVHEHLKILSVLDIPIPKQPRYHYHISAQSHTHAKKWLIRQGIHKQVISIHPGGDKQHPEKRFPIKKYLEFSKSISDKYDSVYILGPDEDDIGKSIGTAFPIFRGSIDQCAALIKKSKVFLSNDSGLGHLAAAVGTKTVTLFGPADWHRIRPFDRQGKVIKPASLKTFKERRMEEGNIDLNNTQFVKKITPEMIL